MKYKVITDTRKILEGIEISLDVEKLGVGQLFDFLGDVYEVVQVGDVIQLVKKGENGRVVVLWNGSFGGCRGEG